MVRELASRAGLVASVALFVGGCACEPTFEPPIDAARVTRDAATDAPIAIDVIADDDAPIASIEDAWIDRVDGCVSPLPLDRAGAPCLDGTDCPPGLLCLPPGGFAASASCQVPSIGGCACPEGSSLTSYVTSSSVHAICAPDSCPLRTTDASRLGAACETLRDCADWMICEGGAGGAASTCALTCSEQCSCPSDLRCESVALPSGVATRCVR